MCGIAGIFHYGVSEPISKDILRKMNDRLVHRGPDDQGVYMEDNIGLAMRRLSIVDIRGGHQPMTNEDGTLWIVFNGEIYNFRELRKELESKHHFKTHTDTEVILHLYEEMGEECVQRLRGMFAFSLWDNKKNVLMLARDRIGKKPLFYASGGGRMAWASEIQALTSLPWISRDIDFEALDLYLGLQYIPSPWTIYKAIRKLPPAHILMMEQGKIRLKRYWELPLEPPHQPLSLAEAKEMILEKFEEAVRLRLVSDVPLGAFLSGGIDSTAVVAMMSRLTNRPVKTFSIGFEEQEFSELSYAREAARYFGTDHTEFIVKPEMTEVLPKIVRHYGEPYADSSALPTYYVAKESRRHVTVALNGDGGDENFAGYLRHMAMKTLALLDPLPAPIKNPASRYLHLILELPSFDGSPLARKMKRLLSCVSEQDLPSRYLRLIGYFTEDQKDKLYQPSFSAQLANARGGSVRYLAKFFDQSQSLDLINRMLYVDILSYLPGCLMTKVDIATMSHSLEARSPLLDHELMECVFRLPGSWKLRGMGSLKWIFKESLRGILPPAVYHRKKMGFGIPLGKWLRGPLRAYWYEHVFSQGSFSRSYFQEITLKRLYENHLSGHQDHGYSMWCLLMLELWQEYDKTAFR